MPIPTLIHLSLMALMVLLCIAAAVIAWRRTGIWIPKHRLLGIMGACSGLVAAGVMVYEKFEHGYPHFKSPHAMIGLGVVVLLVLVPLLGFLGSKGVNALRVPHKFLARILIVMGVLGLVTGTLRYLQITSKPPAAPVPPVTPPGKI